MLFKKKLTKTLESNYLKESLKIKNDDRYNVILYARRFKETGIIKSNTNFILNTTTSLNIYLNCLRIFRNADNDPLIPIRKKK